MANSMDQYLAQHLSQGGHFEVVTDPQRADAIFTDSIGEGFARKMDELYPPENADSKSDDADAEKVHDADMQKVRVGGFSRARGVVFLVDRNSRSVIWSTYDPDWRSGAQKLDSRARSIADRLAKDLKKARKEAEKVSTMQAPAAPAPKP